MAQRIGPTGMLDEVHKHEIQYHQGKKHILYHET